MSARIPLQWLKSDGEDGDGGEIMLTGDMMRGRSEEIGSSVCSHRKSGLRKSMSDLDIRPKSRAALYCFPILMACSFPSGVRCASCIYIISHQYQREGKIIGTSALTSTPRLCQPELVSDESTVWIDRDSACACLRNRRVILCSVLPSSSVMTFASA